MSQKIEIIKCKKCGRNVKLNGIGSSRSGFQRAITSIYGFLAPFTCKRFRPASDAHDKAVHRGKPTNRRFDNWVISVDKEFYEDCDRLAEINTNWITRPYFKKQASELYLALKINNGNGYPKKPCDRRLI